MFLEMQGVSHELGDFHLRDVNLEVREGELFVVLGPSGAGKTILLELIAGFQEPQEGRILLRGDDISGVPPQERNIGYVFQDYALFPHLSVRENIGFGQKYSRGRSVGEAARMMNVEHLLDRDVRTLSGGEQQRVALARALAVSPGLFLFDEPLSSLDARMHDQLQDELRGLLSDLGVTSVYVTHDQTEAMVLGDRIAVMNEGRIVQVGTPREVFTRPANRFAADFVGVENVLDGHIIENNEGLAVVDVGEVVEVVSDQESGRVHVCLRPEDVTLAQDGGRTSARNRLRGRIIDVTPLGALYRVRVDCGFPLTALVTRPSAEEMGLEVGEDITVSFKASAAHVIKRS